MARTHIESTPVSSSFLFSFICFKRTNKSSILHKVFFKIQHFPKKKKHIHFAESIVNKIVECKGTFWISPLVGFVKIFTDHSPFTCGEFYVQECQSAAPLLQQSVLLLSHREIEHRFMKSTLNTVLPKILPAVIQVC